MELKQVLKNKENLVELSKERPGADPRTFTVRQGKIKRAQQELEDMYGTYRSLVYQKSIAILSLGPEAESFNDIADKEFGCYRVNGMGLFEEIADKIDKVHYTDIAATSNLFAMIVDLFQESADEIGISSYPQIVFNKKYSKRLSGREDLINLMANVFFESVGPEIVGHYAITKASKAAFNDDFSGKVVPIVLTIREDLANKLQDSLESIGMKVFVVVSDKQADKEEVGKQLVSIKKKLKK
jgi:hypothetical protein